MVSYMIEIPDQLHREIQERRHRIDISEVCRGALADAVAASPTPSRGYEFGRDVAEDITRMFNGG